MTKRTNGDTLAIRLNVAMTPTPQPAAAGTHQDLERCFLLTVVTVIGREDMRSTGEMGESPVRESSPDGSGVLLAGTVPGVVGCRTGFAERELEAFQAVAD